MNKRHLDPQPGYGMIEKQVPCRACAIDQLTTHSPNGLTSKRDQRKTKVVQGHANTVPQEQSVSRIGRTQVKIVLIHQLLDLAEPESGKY